MNIKGELISYVAVSDNNEIMGHLALEIEERDPNFPQVGMAFVNPKYQGHGCMRILNTKMIEDAEKENFYGIYARGVTTHPFSFRRNDNLSSKRTLKYH
jgi:serine/threonine-protein kinase RsbW